MDKLNKIKNSIEKLIYLKDDMPKSLRNLFSTTEYLSYSISCLFLIYNSIISTIYLFKFIQSKQENLFLLYKTRLLIGQLLTISLTLILGGLVIRLLHITNLKTLLLIVITIMLKELIMSNIDKESSFISKKIEDHDKI